MSGPLGRIGTGVRDTLRLLDPAVRRERRYTFAREKAVRESVSKAVAGEQWLDAESSRGLDERVVEFPWAVSVMGRGDRLLDVGSTLNAQAPLSWTLSRYASVSVLNPFRDDGWRSRDPRVSYVRADVREPGLRPGSFPCMTCLSTLEHVGCDNTRYGAPPGSAEQDPARARADAMRSMRSLLRPGGVLLLSVPFGVRQDLGWLVQFDEAMLDAAVAAFEPARVDAKFFVHANGWRKCGVVECAGARYEQGTRGAEAVACLVLTA